MSVFRPRSKIVSGMGNAQAPFDAKGTSLGSRVGGAFRVTGGSRHELDPAVTFYAALQASPQDLLGAPDGFVRSSEGLYLPYRGADWRDVGNDVPRHEDGMLLMEPSDTNLCQNYNAQPDAALTGISLGGSGILQRVDDAEALQAAGAGRIGNGFAVEIGSTNGPANANIFGVTAATGPHCIGALIKKTSDGGFVNLRTSGLSLTIGITNKEYQYIILSGTVAAGEILQVNTSSGGTARFILNQLETGLVPDSPIITRGAAASRAIDLLEWGNRTTFWNQTQGMLVIRYLPLWDYTLVTAAGSRSIVSLDRTSRSVLHQNRDAGGNYQIVSTDGTQSPFVNLTPAPKVGEVIPCAVRWSTTPSEYQVGAYWQGAWVWSTQVAYSGSFPGVGNILGISAQTTVPARFGQLVVYNEDRGTAWIEANYP